MPVHYLEDAGVDRGEIHANQGGNSCKFLSSKFKALLSVGTILSNSLNLQAESTLPFPALPFPHPGLSLVVGLVLYISSINDEMLNRTKDAETYFNYKYGWSFAFAAISFLLTEVTCPILPCARSVLPYLEGRKETPHSTLAHPPHSTALPQNVPLPGFPGSPPSWMSPGPPCPHVHWRGSMAVIQEETTGTLQEAPISELSSASLSL